MNKFKQFDELLDELYKFTIEALETLDKERVNFFELHVIASLSLMIQKMAEVKSHELVLSTIKKWGVN